MPPPKAAVVPPVVVFAVNEATILRSRFHNNTATNQGAGLSNAAYDSGATSTITIDRSSFTANTTTGGTTAAFGGGIANFVGPVYGPRQAINTAGIMTIRNSTISSNRALNSNAGAGYGGGIFHEVDCGFQQPNCGSAALTLEHVTIFANEAGRGTDFIPERGGGVWANNNSTGGTFTTTFRNTLVAGNSAGGVANDCREVTTSFVRQNFNIDSSNTCGFNVFSLQQLNLSALDFSGPTYFHTPRAGSAAIDKGACFLTVDQVGTTRPQGNACDVGAIESTSAPPPPVRRQVMSDFNGDGRSDPGIFRPTQQPNALWYSVPSGGGNPFQIFFGQGGDIPVPADYDGDQRTDAVIFRPSTGLWYGPRTGAAEIVVQIQLGQNGDIPIPCDYDGDGAVDPAIFRPSTGLFFGVRRNGQTVVLNTQFGGPNDIPVPADYNGDGRCDPAIMRAGSGPGGTNLWYAPFSGGGGAFQIFFGAVGDIPAPGDYDGDNRADAVIFRPSNGLWYGPSTGNISIAVQILLGQNGDFPVAGDYDGNGRVDPAVYTPSTGKFFGVATNGQTIVLDANLGRATGDIPTPKRPSYAGAYPYGPNRDGGE
jgi:hypothetical protein